MTDEQFQWCNEIRASHGKPMLIRKPASGSLDRQVERCLEICSPSRDVKFSTSITAKRGGVFISTGDKTATLIGDFPV